MAAQPTQISSITNDLLAGAFGDSIGPLVAQFLPGLLKLVLGKVGNALSGTSNFPVSVADIFSGTQPGYSAYRYYTHENYVNTFGDYFKTIAANDTRAYVASIFQGLGYSPERADLLSYGGAGSLMGTVLNLTGASPKAASSTIAQAMYRRRFMFTTDTGEEESIYSQVTGAERLNSLLSKMVDDGRMGTLDRRESAVLAASLLSTGRYDSYSADGNEDRYNRLASDVARYSKGLERLRSVIGKDIPEVVATLSTIFGGNALNASVEEISKLSATIVQGTVGTGMSMERFAALNGQLYKTMFAPIGGSALQTMGVTKDIAGWTAAGAKDQYMSQQQFQAGLGALHADIYASGDTRYMTAAFRLFAENNALDPYSRDTVSAFWKAYNGKGLNSTAADALRFMETINDGALSYTDLNELLTGRETNRLIDVGAGGIQSTLFNKKVEQARDLVEREQDSLMKSLEGIGVSVKLKAAMSRDEVYSTVREAAQRADVSFTDVRGALAAYNQNIKEGMRSIGGAYGEELEQGSYNIEFKQQQDRAERIREDFDRLYAGVKTPRGLSAVFQALKQKGSTVGDLLAASLGANAEQLRSLNPQAIEDFVKASNEDELRTAIKQYGITLRDEGGTTLSLEDSVKEAMKIKTNLSDLVTGYTVEGLGIALLPENVAAESDEARTLSNKHAEYKKRIADQLYTGTLDSETIEEFIKITRFADEDTPRFLQYLAKSSSQSSQKTQKLFGTTKFENAFKEYKVGKHRLQSSGAMDKLATDQQEDVLSRYTELKQTLVGADSKVIKYIKDYSSLSKEERTKALDGMNSDQVYTAQSLIAQLQSDQKYVAGLETATGAKGLSELFSTESLVGTKSATDYLEQIMKWLNDVAANGLRIIGK